MAQHVITTTHANIWSRKQVLSKSCQSAFSDPGIFGDVQPTCHASSPHPLTTPAMWLHLTVQGFSR